MSRNTASVRLVTLSLAGLVAVAHAQEGSRNSIRGSSFRDLPICQSEGSASRVRACDPESIATTRSEKEITFSAEPPARPTQCQASVATEYLQFERLVNVESTIEVKGCAAASGEYEIAARVADENGKTTTLEFSEVWQRDDEEGPVTLKASYPIGENVELLNLRVRGVHCACKDPVD
jgi:hypothetical protein